MKFTAIFLLLCCFRLNAAVFSQTVTLHVKNAPLHEVLEKFNKQTGYTFIYTGTMLKEAKKVNLEIENLPFAEALEACFNQQPFTYVIIDKTVVLRHREDKESNAAGPPPPAEIRGRVVDAANQPLIGVSVGVVGTSIGTTTDTEGYFRLTVPDDIKAVLRFSAIGYKTKDVPAGQRTQVNVELEEDVAGLNEIVVVGYGTGTKKDLTGSVSSVHMNSIASTPAMRVDQMLQGKAAGMMVTQVNGSPGAPASIRIRGNSSITASSEPLYVIDGLIGLGDLSTINPADIEEISVLKDASATAIYGSRGANGVILITTKRGSVGPARINANVRHGRQWLPRKIDLLSGQQYADLLNETRVAAGAAPVYDKPELVPTTNWQDEVMQTAPMTDVNISINGGSEKVRYFIAASHFNQEGIIKSSGVKRAQFRANIESRFSDKIRVGVNMNAGTTNTDNNTVPAAAELIAPPSIPIFNADGSYFYDHPDPQFNGRYNTPAASRDLITVKNYRANLALNAFAEYSPLNWITIRSTYGGQMLSYGRSNSYTDSRLPGQITNQQLGAASITYNDNTNYQNENTISFKNLNNSVHSFDGIIGLTFQGGVGQNAGGSAREFISDAAMWNNLAAGNPATRNITSGYENWSMTSYLARLTYKYKDRYLATVTGRVDGSSRLGAGNKWASFPSLALGWIASNETFIKDLQLFSFLKLRASYGRVGNQAVGIYQTMSLLTSINALVNGERVNGWAPGNVSGNNAVYGNPDLRWEVKDQLDLGLEMSFFNNRLDVSLDYYNASTKDLLLLTEIPSQTGYTQQMANVGQVANKGFDLTVNGLVVDHSNFKWSARASVAHNRNRVQKLGPTGADVITHVYNAGLRPVGVLRVGEPIGSFLTYVSDGIWKEAQGQNSIMPGAVAGSIRYRDISGDGKIDQQDQVISGNGSPSWYGGLGTELSYKNFGLDVYFSAATGAKVFNGNAAALRSTNTQFNHYPEVANRWHPTRNPDSNVPGALNQNVELYPSDRWVFDASYIRLESANVYYKVPLGETARKYIQSATINVAVSNLFCLSPYNRWGYDPVVNEKGGSDLGYNNSLQGFDYGAYPRSAVLTVGANFTF